MFGTELWLIQQTSEESYSSNVNKKNLSTDCLKEQKQVAEQMIIKKQSKREYKYLINKQPL